MQRPDMFPALRLLELTAQELGLNQSVCVIFNSLQSLQSLEEVSVFQAGALSWGAIEQIMHSLPGLQRFSVGYSFRGRRDYDVSADWMLSLERRLWPRAVRGTLLPTGSLSQP